MSLSPRIFLNALLLVASLASAQDYTSPYQTTHNGTFTPDAVLRVTTRNLAQSCLPEKLTVVVNGTSPGPALRLQEGRTTWIRVYNDMANDNLTMHWHGLSQACSPFSDGTPLASQWPIPPLHFFDYELSIPKGMAGTYFYHSHVAFQAVSATGPLIVEDIASPYEYDDEKIIFLTDTFNKTDENLVSGLLADPFVWSGETGMILVNGKGGGTNNGTFCNSNLSVINVKPDTTYRLRFIGGTALTFASIAIQGHESLTVIEADGGYTQPYNTSYLQIGSGQRFSVLLTTRKVPGPDPFYIQVESRERPTIARSYAMLSYVKNLTKQYLPPQIQPFTLPNTTLGFLDYQLSPLSQDPDFPTVSQVTRRIIITVHQHANGTITWLSNGRPWTESVPQAPYLVSLYDSDAQNYPSITRAIDNNNIDPITDTIPAEIGEVLEIVLQNTGSDSGGLDVHPYHIHGAHIFDLGSGNGTYDVTENEKLWVGKQPIKRDTTMLYRYATKTSNGTAMGWRAWRLRVTNPGVWMLHCHILQHMIMGMQSVLVFGNSTEVLTKVPTPEVEGYLTYGGSVYGNESFWPTVVHFQDMWADNQ